MTWPDVAGMAVSGVVLAMMMWAACWVTKDEVQAWINEDKSDPPEDSRR